MAKRISIINFKGGVGKTTLAFNLGAGLARFHGAAVLLVDMDHQSSLSIVCLGRRGWEGCSDRTVDGIFKHFPAPNLPGSEVIHDSSFGQGNRYASVHIVPAKLDPYTFPTPSWLDWSSLVFSAPGGLNRDTPMTIRNTCGLLTTNGASGFWSPTWSMVPAFPKLSRTAYRSMTAPTRRTSAVEISTGNMSNSSKG